MNFFDIFCKIGDDNNFQIPNHTVILDISNKKKLSFSFWDFKNKNNKILFLPNFPKNEAIDLLYLSLSVYYADRIIKRSTFPDGWTRFIRIFLPVLEYEKWEKNLDLVEEMLSYLSGDIWKIELRRRDLNSKENDIKSKIFQHQEKIGEPDAFCMLSGGIDSFIGAIDLLESKNQVCFIGHYGGSRGVSQSQKRINSVLMKKYSLTEKSFFNFYATPKNGIENSTRTRSLLFFAHAIAIISSFNSVNKLIIPENGFISLNIPLNYTRLGSSSTRTTHPYYLKLLQSLLKNIGLDIALINPYQFKTKGEMILESKNIRFLKSNLRNTMSCSHPDNSRYRRDSQPRHCGYCLPCIIRRSAILRAFSNDATLYQNKNFRSSSISKNNLKVYKIGILKSQERNINPKFIVHSSGPLDGNYSEYCDLYQRGIEEMALLIDNYEYKQTT